MTRAEILQALAVLVQRGTLTTEQAARILQDVDAGRLTAADLPMPAALAIAPPAYNESEERNRFYALIIILGLQSQIAARQDNGLQRLPLDARLQMRDYLRAQFTVGAMRGATDGRINVRAWQAGMMEQIAGYIRRQAMAGAGAPVTLDRRPADQEERRQLAYLYWFAWAVAARQAIGQAIPRAGVAHRSAMYQGGGWFAWHRYNEMPAQGEDYLVFRYVALDDPNTCGPCSSHSGRYYLPGEGPYPGQICAGGGACRCERVPVYDAAIWAQITGNPIPAAAP